MSIIQFDRPPSWSLVVSKTGESTKCPWVGVVHGVNSMGSGGGKNREAVTASLCLAFKELVATAMATPDWSRDNRVHQSAEGR